MAERNSSRSLPRVDRARRELRTPRAAGVAGIVFAVLFAGTLLLARPPGQTSGVDFSRWYSGPGQSVLVIAGLYAIPFAGIAFLWFIGVVRDRIGEREDRFFSTVFLGSGLLFVAMLFAAAACGSALALRADTVGTSGPVSPLLLSYAQAVTYSFLYVYAARTAGVFTLVTSTIVWRTEAVPRWVAVVGFAIALALMLSVRYFQLIITLFPVWVALVSVFILVTSGKIGIDDEASPQPAAGSPGEPA